MMELNNKTAQPTQLPISVVRKLLHRGARANLARIFAKAYPVEVARLFALLGVAERAHAFAILLSECEPAHAAQVLSEMSAGDSIALLQTLDAKQIARLLNEMPADDATVLVTKLPKELVADALALMEAEMAADVRELLEHEEKTAGRIMSPDYFALDEEVTVSEAITALQRRSEDFEMVFYVFVTDKRDHLVGVVSLKKLLTTPPTQQLKRIMIPNVISARTTASQEEVARLVSEYNLLAIPVVDEADRLVGIVTVDDVLDVMQDEVAEDLLALSGVAAEERISTGAWRSIRLRVPWLLINLLTASAAALIVSEFEKQIGQQPRLAVLMPIVAGLGGNAATQTLTVMIRGMAIGELSSLSRMTLKSILVGASNGLIVGLVGAAAAAVFYNIWFGLVLALAMVINMMIGGLAATLVPVILKRMRVDPAVSSSIFVTACTDVFGFLSFLGIATLLLHLLT